MKKTMRYITMLCAAAGVALLPSCKEERMEADTDADRRIYLRAMVEGTTATTRVPYILTAPDRNNPLNVAVWASTTQHVFTHTDGANGKDGTVALHTTANFTNGSEQLLNEAVYPKATSGTASTVYFVGLHPQTGWTTTDGQTAISTVINGKTDVMFAPQISGTYGGNTTGDKWPTFKFHHLLTWLRIQMVAESDDVRGAWGKVTDLTIQSKTQVSIDLSKGEANIADAATFSGDETDLPFYHKDTNDEFLKEEYYELKAPYGDENMYDKVEEVAYVLCAPVEATAADTDGTRTTEYTLTVKTENRPEGVTVNVDLMDGADSYFDENTRNHQFVLLLKFKMGDNISVMAQPVDWVTGGLGSGEMNEN